MGRIEYHEKEEASILLGGIRDWTDSYLTLLSWLERFPCRLKKLSLSLSFGAKGILLLWEYALETLLWERVRFAVTLGLILSLIREKCGCFSRLRDVVRLLEFEDLKKKENPLSLSLSTSKRTQSERKIEHSPSILLPKLFLLSSNTFRSFHSNHNFQMGNKQPNLYTHSFFCVCRCSDLLVCVLQP